MKAVVKAGGVALKVRVHYDCKKGLCIALLLMIIGHQNFTTTIAANIG